MTKQTEEELPVEDGAQTGSPKACDMPDTENIKVLTNKQTPVKNARNQSKRMPFVRRLPQGRKRSYSYSEGHSGVNKRYKRGGVKTPTAASGTKFLFGGNIRDPLNLNALGTVEGDRRKSDSILQPKKFEGYPTRSALVAVPGKRWKRNNSSSYEKKKFLLGGNFRDPLNLNSLSDEKVAQIANAVTPESSPMPTPKHRKAEYKIEVLIPPNISDPLNLMSFDDENSSAATEFLSPEVGNRLRRHQGKGSGSNLAKFDLSDLASNKKGRFRKRAKSLVVGTLNSSEQSALETAARVTIANRKQLETETKEEKTTTVKEESKETETELKSDQVESEKAKEAKVSPKKVDLGKEGVLPPPIELPRSTETQKKSVTIAQPVQEKPKKSGRRQRFEYGNYNRYYGYRNPSSGIFPETIEDLRLIYLRPEWFFGKDVLDIGCNVGSLTLEIGRRFSPKSLLGVDIDPELISIAKKFAENLKKYQVPPSAKATPIPCMSAGATPSRGTDLSSIPALADSSINPQNCESLFPIAFPLLYGPLEPTSVVGGIGVSGGGLSERSGSATATPHPYQTPRASVHSAGSMGHYGRKVRFLCENYVLENDELVELAQPEFDTILCLSTTKWIHLNFGDDGIKRAFKRMYAQLRPGGILILEAQGYASYNKRKKLTSRISENYQDIQFRPEQFSEFLLHEVGFSTAQVIGVPRHPSKGFQRPIQVFVKMPLLSTRSIGESGSSQTTPNYCASCSCSATPHSSHTTPYHSCSGSCQATPHYYHHYNNLNTEGETPVHSSTQ